MKKTFDKFAVIYDGGKHSVEGVLMWVKKYVTDDMGHVELYRKQDLDEAIDRHAQELIIVYSPPVEVIVHYERGNRAGAHAEALVAATDRKTLLEFFGFAVRGSVGLSELRKRYPDAEVLSLGD